MKKNGKNIDQLQPELNKLKDLQAKLNKLIGPGIGTQPSIPNYPKEIPKVGEKVPHLTITEFLQILNDRVNGMWVVTVYNLY